MEPAPQKQVKQVPKEPEADNKEEKMSSQEKPVEKKAPPKVVKNPLMRSNPDPLSRKPKEKPTAKIQIKPEQIQINKPTQIKEQQKKEEQKSQTPIIDKKQPDLIKNQIKDITQPKEDNLKPEIARGLIKNQQLETQVPKSNKDLKDLVSEIAEPTIKQRITVKIINSMVKGTTLSKYTVYEIEGTDNHGPFHVHRKQNQFVVLRKSLRQRWPGAFLPAISFKSELKTSTEKDKQTRIIFENFIIGLNYSQHLYYREEVQLFLRSQEIDIEEFTSKMPILKAPDIIERYHSCFDQNLLETKLETKPIIRKFIATLHRTIPRLKELTSKALALSESFSNYSLALSHFRQISRTYEQNCLSMYTSNKREDTIIMKDESNFVNSLQNQTKVNPFLAIYEFINSQLRDAEAFLETILSCDEFTDKCKELTTSIRELDTQIYDINHGHSTVKTVTSRKSNEEILAELEIKVKKLRKDEYIVNQIHTMTSSLLVKITIDTFKQYQREGFRLILLEWEKSTAKVNPEVQALWKSIWTEAHTLLK